MRDDHPVKVMYRFGFALLIFSVFAVVSAAVLQNVDVTYQDGRYELVVQSQLSAPREAVFDILTDYEQFGRISRTYTAYGFLDPTPDGTPVVYTTMEGCVLFFCKSMHRVEVVEIRAPDFIRAVALPEQSDFRYAVSQWDLESRDGVTHLTYRLEVEPDFWVPPVVGPWILKRRLESGGRRGVNRIERLALENSALGLEH